MSYTVTYKELPSGSTNSQKVNAARTQATLTGLKEYTNYSIAVFAATSKGEGNASEPIIVITDEDSRCNLFIVMCLFVHREAELLASSNANYVFKEKMGMNTPLSD